MKSLMEVMKVAKGDLPIIYCDMDEVLCAFMKGAEKAIGSDFASTDKERRWSVISNTKNFWSSLDWMPGAKRLYRAPAGTLPARGCALVLLHLPARLDEPCDQVLRNGLALLLGNDLTNTGSETSLVHGRALLDQVAQV